MPHVILTGGPGVGKTTLLAALRAAGHATVAESARAVIAERKVRGESPRPAPLAFAQEVVRRDLAAYAAAPAGASWVFFDRGLVDGLGSLAETQGLAREELDTLLRRHPFFPVAFVLPPWREIYTTDSERDQSFDDCLRVHASIVRWYARCGFQLCEVPRGDVSARADFVLATLRDGIRRHGR